ncbi:MAG: capsular biosynthesis protein, partial [Acidiphilium sp. 37-67-22]
VLRPETLPFAEQMGLFAGARAIVGPMGSGLHNAIFAGPDCVTGVIRCHALDQSAIAALRGQQIGLLSEGIHETAPQAYSVEPGRFRRFLAALLQS